MYFTIKKPVMVSLLTFTQNDNGGIMIKGMLHVFITNMSPVQPSNADNDNKQNTRPYIVIKCM